MASVTIYTDGSGTTAGNPGGWAALLLCGDRRKEICGGMADATNNRAELTAAIEGLRALRGRHTVLIMTDSEYLRDGINGRLKIWAARGFHRSTIKLDRQGKKVPLTNGDLWRELWEATNAQANVSAKWVKGHNGDPYNETVDYLARKMRAEIKNGGKPSRYETTEEPSLI